MMVMTMLSLWGDFTVQSILHPERRRDSGPLLLVGPSWRTGSRAQREKTSPPEEGAYFGMAVAETFLGLPGGDVDGVWVAKQEESPWNLPRTQTVPGSSRSLPL